MTDLQEFEHQIQHKLADDSRTPHWTPEEAQQYMFDVGVRRQRFEHLASHLIDAVIRPRLEILGSYFPTADVLEDEPPRHCTCWIGYTERFPAVTKVTLSVDHDIHHQEIAVCYDAHMMPTFIKFNEHDRLTLAVDAVDDAVVANWVEKRLLEFVDAYLQIDSSGGPVEHDMAIDPVCGMRINRSTAAARGDYQGHDYYFCSNECETKFSRDPSAYACVKNL